MSESTGASPVLRSPVLRVGDHLEQGGLIVRKRQRSGSEENTSSKRNRMEKKIDDVLSELVSLKSTLASKEDIKKLDTRLDNVEKEQTNTQKRLDRLENMKEGLGQARGKGGTEGGDRIDEHQVQYLEARRSLFASPVAPHIANVKDFLIEQMKIPVDVVRDLEIADIRQIHPKNLPEHRRASGLGLGARPPKKVKFRLRDSYERDLVLSYTRNLRNENRVDIVIPEYLMPLKSKLEGLGYKLRKHTGKTGSKISTSLRLEDKSMGLVMAVRERREDPWLHYSLKELKELEGSLSGCGGGECDEQEDEETV